MATGRVKTIRLDNGFGFGFGFVAPDDESGQDGDLFCHQSSVTEGNVQDLDRGQQVSVTDQPDPGRAALCRAVGVTRVWK